MGKRRSQPFKTAPVPRGQRKRWPVFAIVLIAVAVVLALTTMRSTPPAADAPPSATTFLPTIENTNRPPGPAPDGMVWIPGGEFSMGAHDPMDRNDAVGMQATTDSRPVHRVFVDGFWMDATEVTNEQFAAFVKATRYVTVAERTPRAEDFPGAPPESLVPGSVVFTPPDHAVPLTGRVSMVVGDQGNQLAPSARPGQLDRGERAFSRSSISHMQTRSPTRSGPASACRPKRSGSLRPAEA
jgi:formylglycine-generating enzyme required for sulfatase activity